ncbi:radical SAM protein [Ancylomarina sp. DW003]|nr:radical SAM protein [Ancylomarina sp. DW003]MDE5420655.1 radical SAM protein [Ancylomarina sp. DW003]
MKLDLDTPYTLSSHYILRNDNGNDTHRESYVLYNIQKSEIINLSESLFRILNFFEFNKISLGELEEFIRSENREFPKGELKRIFSNPQYFNFLSKNDSPRIFTDIANIQFELPIKISKTPTLVEIHPTTACNLKCPHCYIESSPENLQNKRLEVKKWKSLIDELEKLKTPNLNISGGEPLVYPGIKELLSYLTSKRIRTTLLTNGTLIDEDIIEYLTYPNISTTISLDGVSSNTHDKIRGSGHFKKLFKILNTVKGKISLNLCFTLTDINKHEVEGFVQLCKELEVDAASIIVLQNIGRSKENSYLHSKEKDKDINQTQQLLKKYEKDIKINLIFNDSSGEERLDRSTDCVSCSGLTSTLFINEIGDAFPCAVSSKSNFFKIGNVFDSSVLDIWRKPKEENPFRGGIKYHQLKECIECPDYKTCVLKTCRAKAFIAEDNLYGVPCKV